MIENAHASGHSIPEKKVIEMFLSLCEAVLAFHTHDPPYAHRDIKVLYLFICNLHNHSLLITNLKAPFMLFVNTNP